MTTLGTLLRTARDAAGLTQEELAVQVFRNSRHQSLISRWEADLIEPSLINLRKVARRLALPLGVLDDLPLLEGLEGADPAA